VHSFSDLQDPLTHKERHAMWDLADALDEDCNGLLPNSIQEAVLTHWWSVTAAARTALKRWKQWQKFAEAVANSTKTDTKMGKIAQDLTGLMSELKLCLHLLFIVAFSESLFVEHFEWLQDHDTHAKDFECQSRNMSVRSFLITMELEKLKLEWRTRSELSKFEAHVNAVLNHERSTSSQAKKADPLCRLTWTKLQFYET
jgi:deferrochelatase/peroxidase EfeB